MMGNRIQTLRKDLGYSQEELAKKIGVSRQSISKWELNASEPDMNNIIALADALRVSTDYLLLGEEIGLEKEELGREELVQKILYWGCFLFLGLGFLLALVSHLGIIPPYMAYNYLGRYSFEQDVYVDLGMPMGISIIGIIILNGVLIQGSLIQLAAIFVFNRFYERENLSREVAVKKSNFRIASIVTTVPFIISFLNFKLYTFFSSLSMKSDMNIKSQRFNGVMPKSLGEMTEKIARRYTVSFYVTTGIIVLLVVGYLLKKELDKRKLIEEG